MAHKILSPTEIAEKILKKQMASDGVKYRPSIYCISVTTDDGSVLIHNMLTKSMLLLTEEEAYNWGKTFVYDHETSTDCVKELIALRYYVPENLEEHKVMLELRQLAKMIEARKKNKTKTYTILTTTDCNARCFYCYELGRSRIRMTEQTAKDVCDYIKEDKIIIQWFGGEPLYNMPVIDIICQNLKDRGIEYSAQMTTNAYLFDEDIVKKAKDLWKLRSVQITLDGTEKIYNRCKAFIYKNTNAYQHVMHNISLLLDAGISVKIRLNIDMHNAEDLMLLADELKELFAEKKGLSVYSHTIFENTLKHKRSEEQRRVLYLKQDTLNERLKRNGLNNAKNTVLNKKIKINYCKVDSGNGEMILPDGHIGLCEHLTEDHYIGHIKSPNKDKESIRQQTEIFESMKCSTCPLSPDCIRLKICHNVQECYPEDRVRKIRALQDAMLSIYKETIV